MYLDDTMTPYFTPGLYWQQETASFHAPMSVLSDNQMPVPAVDPSGTPGVVMPGPVLLGQSQVQQPRVTPKYASRR